LRRSVAPTVSFFKGIFSTVFLKMQPEKFEVQKHKTGHQEKGKVYPA